MNQVLFSMWLEEDQNQSGRERQFRTERSVNLHVEYELFSVLLLQSCSWTAELYNSVPKSHSGFVQLRVKEKSDQNMIVPALGQHFRHYKVISSVVPDKKI